MRDTDATIAGWVEMQIAHWRGQGLHEAAAERAFEAISRRRHDVFLFDFDQTGVRIRPKPHYTAADMAARRNGLIWRACCYRDFFDLVVSSCGLRLRGTLAMTMEDYVRDIFPVPVFGFQKLAGSTLVLMPDVDTVRLNYYRDMPPDALSYHAKIRSAIFVGSTTGMVHDVASVAALACQRIRSGVFFRDVAEVDFRLPTIVQCVTPEAEQAIRDLGFGAGAADWTEQLNHRFLISMDGNGATCSRVAMALRSNSVLLKYDSPYQLYYFPGLVARRHYVPIGDDPDVITVVRAEALQPGLYRAIAGHGTRFFDDYLTMAPSIGYAGRLLEAYFQCFERSGSPAGPEPEASERPAVGLVGTVHVSHRGDLTGDPGDWLGAEDERLPIEGLMLVPLHRIGRGDLLYRGIGTEGPQPWCMDGALAGSRGRSEALTGVTVRLSERVAGRFVCRTWAKFEDGASVGPIQDGGDCVAPSGAKLTAIKVRIEPRPVQ